MDSAGCTHIIKDLQPKKVHVTAVCKSFKSGDASNFIFPKIEGAHSSFWNRAEHLPAIWVSLYFVLVTNPWCVVLYSTRRWKYLSRNNFVSSNVPFYLKWFWIRDNGVWLLPTIGVRVFLCLYRLKKKKKFLGTGKSMNSLFSLMSFANRLVFYFCKKKRKFVVCLACLSFPKCGLTWAIIDIIIRINKIANHALVWNNFLTRLLLK